MFGPRRGSFLRLLKSAVTVDDYVVVKVDIDPEVPHPWGNTSWGGDLAIFNRSLVKVGKSAKCGKEPLHLPHFPRKAMVSAEDVPLN